MYTTLLGTFPRKRYFDSREPGKGTLIQPLSLVLVMHVVSQCIVMYTFHEQAGHSVTI